MESVFLLLYVTFWLCLLAMVITVISFIVNLFINHYVKRNHVCEFIEYPYTNSKGIWGIDYVCKICGKAYKEN